MRSITVFVENLAGDLGTNAYLSSNKFDGVDQASTTGLFKPGEVRPLGVETKAKQTTVQQDTKAPLSSSPDHITVDKNVISGQKSYADKKQHEGTNQGGNIVGRLFKWKSEDQGVKG